MPNVLPPVPMTFRKSAPSLISCRAALRTPSTPSASEPMNQQWPPVVVIGRPAAKTRGPLTSPCLMASLSENVVLFQPPQSHTVVTPDCNAMDTLCADRMRRMSSVSSRCTSSPLRPVPGMLVWVWQSMRPGRSVASGNSSTSPVAAPGNAILSSGPIAWMRSSCNNTAMPVLGGLSVPSMRRAGFSMVNVGVAVVIIPPGLSPGPRLRDRYQRV